jgi:Xaa-Pro aminopeptidase
MKARGLDGIVATAPWNVFYLTGFNGIAHKSDEPRPYAVIVARHVPEHPIMVLADYYLATFPIIAWSEQFCSDSAWSVRASVYFCRQAGARNGKRRSD